MSDMLQLVVQLRLSLFFMGERLTMRGPHALRD